MCVRTYTHMKTEQYTVIKGYKNINKETSLIHTDRYTHTHMKTEKGSINTWEFQLAQSKRNVNVDEGGWSDHAL